MPRRPNPIDHLDEELARLDAGSLLRRPSGPADLADEALIDVSSNDYLGYGRQTVSRETLDALGALPCGAGASRLIHGTRADHLRLEESLAAWVGQPRALTFASGYAANVGAIAALARRGDWIVSDRLNHASLIDGCRLSRATVRIVEHLDTDAVARALYEAPPGARCWVVTESYFSMDGDSPDLPALRRLCDERGAALVVDEAHALGVLGPGGAGLCAAAEVRADLLIGTLGKALGCQGAFVAGSDTVITWLWNRARSFVFSTGISPLLARVARDQIARARAAESTRSRLATRCERLASLLGEARIPLPRGRHGPIFPILLGSPERALRVAAALHDDGFRAQAIRPPTVPDGTARLRITLNAALPETALETLATSLVKACRDFP